jgi:hypothetical protein
VTNCECRISKRGILATDCTDFTDGRGLLIFDCRFLIPSTASKLCDRRLAGLGTREGTKGDKFAFYISVQSMSRVEAIGFRLECEAGSPTNRQPRWLPTWGRVACSTLGAVDGWVDAISLSAACWELCRAYGALEFFRGGFYRHAGPLDLGSGLVADVAGMVASVVVCRLVFG